MQKPNFCDEVEAFLKVKKPSTQHEYKSGLRRFRQFYGEKDGQDKTILYFIDKVSEDIRKPRREQKRVIEVIYALSMRYF